MAVTAKNVIEALTGEFDVRAYSGRGMMGEQCIGVDIDRDGEIMKIGAALIQSGVDADDVLDLGDRMRTDQMGKGIIVYWPSLKVTPEQIAQLRDDDEEDEDE